MRKTVRKNDVFVVRLEEHAEEAFLQQSTAFFAQECTGFFAGTASELEADGDADD